MTQKKLEFFVRKWQKILRLQDWGITIKRVNHDGFYAKGVYDAEVVTNSDTKEADLCIIKSDQYSKWNDKEQDVESDSVHEFVHFYLGPIERYARAGEEKALEVAKENAANIISAALIMLDRRA